MNYASLVTDLQDKIAGIDRTLTLTAGTDTKLINLGWRALWSKMMAHKKVAGYLFRTAKSTLTVTASKNLELPARSGKVLMIRTNLELRKEKSLERLVIDKETGWCYAGQKADNDTTKIIEVYESGELAGAGASYDVWVCLSPLPLASAYSAGVSIAIPTVPEEYHEFIGTYAAYEYFNRKGIRYQAEASKFLQTFNSGVDELIREISWIDDEPEFLM